MGQWSKLSAQEKAQIIKFAIKNGVSDINSIRDTYNVYADGGSIHIDKNKRGTFTAAATKHGKSVQEFARQVLANPENYSPAMRRKANFARNSAKWHKHDGNSDTQYLNTEVYEPWFPDRHKDEYGFSIGQWLRPMHVREMQLGNARNHSEASLYLVDSNKEFINDYISRLSATHPELSSTALSDIKASLLPESISFVPDSTFAKSNIAGETVAHREGNKIIPKIKLRDNIGYYDTPNKSRDLSNIFRHELNHFLRKYQGNYADSIFNQDERDILNSAYFAVSSTLERAAENARLRSIISQNHDNVWGKELDDIIDNLSYEDLLSYISNMEGYMKDSESLYTAPDKKVVADLQSRIAEKDKERDAILNTVIYPKYLMPYEDGVYVKDNIINKYKTKEGEDASGVRDAMLKEWDENKDLKRIDSERKNLENELKKILMVPNKERLDAVKRALKQVAQNNSGFQKSDNSYLAALGGNLKSTGGPLYPFSFQKNPYLKVPAVRYGEGGKKSTPSKAQIVRSAWDNENPFNIGLLKNGMYEQYDDPNGEGRDAGPGLLVGATIPDKKLYTRQELDDGGYNWRTPVGTNRSYLQTVKENMQDAWEKVKDNPFVNMIFPVKDVSEGHTEALLPLIIPGGIAAAETYRVLSPVAREAMQMSEQEFRALYGVGKDYVNTLLRSSNPKAVEKAEKLLNSIKSNISNNPNVTKARQELIDFLNSRLYRGDEFIRNLQIENVQNTPVRLWSENVAKGNMNEMGLYSSPLTKNNGYGNIFVQDANDIPTIRHELGHSTLQMGMNDPYGIIENSEEFLPIVDKGLPAEFQQYYTVPDEVRTRYLGLGVEAMKRNLTPTQFYKNALEYGPRYVNNDPDIVDLMTRYDKGSVLNYLKNIHSDGGYLARNSDKWHKHDGDSDTQYLNTEVYEPWLPDFAYNLSIQSDNGKQLVQSILQDEGLQKAVKQKALQRQAEREASRKAVSEIYNGMPNPGAGFLSGTDPLLQAIVDMTPAGDAEMATEAASELRNENLKEAALLGSAILLPNIFNTHIKKWRNARKISNIIDESSRLYAKRSQDNFIRDFNSPKISVPIEEGVLYHATNGRILRPNSVFLKTTSSGQKILTGIEHTPGELSLNNGVYESTRRIAGKDAIDYIWWDNAGHNKAKIVYIRKPNGAINVLDNLNSLGISEVRGRYEPSYFVTFPGEASLDNTIKLEYDPFSQSYVPSVAGKMATNRMSPTELLNLLSENQQEVPSTRSLFKRTLILKIPAVRYDEGGEIRNWDNTLTGKLINYVENSDSIGWNPADRTWKHPTLPGYDKNQIGMGVDKNETPGYLDYIQYRPKTNIPFLTELDERLIRHNAIEAANKSANARYKFAQKDVDRPKGTVSPIKDAAVVSAIYNLGAGYVANGLFEDKDFMLKLFDGTDKEVVDRINQEYKKKNRNERIHKTDEFLFAK